MRSSISALLLLAGALLLILACVMDEHQRAVAAHEDYQACLAEHEDSREACSSLEERYRTAVRQYEESSRRAWGCDPRQEECPTPR